MACDSMVKRRVVLCIVSVSLGSGVGLFTVPGTVILAREKSEGNTEHNHYNRSCFKLRFIHHLRQGPKYAQY